MAAYLSESRPILCSSPHTCMHCQGVRKRYARRELREQGVQREREVSVKPAVRYCRVQTRASIEGGCKCGGLGPPSGVTSEPTCMISM